MNIAQAVKRVAHAVSNDETRPQLRCLYFEHEPNAAGPRQLVFATDGHRLSVVYPSLEYLLLGAIDCTSIAPCKLTEDAIRTEVSKNMAHDRAPKWRHVVPHPSVTPLATVTLDRLALSKAVQAADRDLAEQTRLEIEDRAGHLAPKEDLVKRLQTHLDELKAKLGPEGKNDPELIKARERLRIARVDLANFRASHPTPPRKVGALLTADAYGITLRAKPSALQPEPGSAKPAHLDVTFESRSGAYHTVGISTLYLTQALRAASPAKTVTLKIYGELDPVLLSFSDGFELIMPMRV